MIETNKQKQIQTHNLNGKNIIAIASGKGGVGKTFIAISLAHAFALKGEKVLLIDGDLGLSNIDIQLGLATTKDLATVLCHNIPINNAITHDETIHCDVLAGHSGSQTLAGLDESRLQLLCDDIKILAQHYDRVIIDLGSGILKSTSMMASIANNLLIVTTDTPTALADAYAFIKIMTSGTIIPNIQILINMANTLTEGEHTYYTLSKACQSFLNLTPALAGILHLDSFAREAIRTQTPVLAMDPLPQIGKDILKIQFALSQEK